MAAVDRVEALRAEAASDASGAADKAWQWIVELQQLGKKDHKAAEFELNEIFRMGRPAEGLDGPTDGILVLTTTNPLLDNATKVLTSVWMPWEGKRFDAGTSTGDNRMTGASVIPSKFIWPLYSIRKEEGGRTAFDFKTYVEPGKEDPDVDVLVIDYADVPSNPLIVIRQIRDELVEVVPGTYLGKVLFKLPVGGYSRIGFFALRTN